MDAEVARLKALLKQKDEQIETLQKKLDVPTVEYGLENFIPLQTKNTLSNAEIMRYSRQLILPEIGVQGQLKISSCSVLVVGCGGLGCPAAVYLAAAGIGRIGLIDYDAVELSNLHRQILHTQTRIGVKKSASAAMACSQLNSHVQCIPYHIALNSSNALDLIKLYDIVLDCTDNVATRYLVNDACVLADKPLISGSALRFEGQLTVYNYDDAPCYRCLYQKPPPAETVTNCSDGGVLGVVPGIIGSIQALEAIKIASGIGPGFAKKLLLFNAIDCSFMSIKLRSKQTNCAVCGTQPSITQLIDYEQFCGAKATDKDKGIRLLSDNQRISAADYKQVLDSGSKHVLLDVRQSCELDICKLPSDCTINVSIDQIKNNDKLQGLTKDLLQYNVPVFVVCRRGNDSQQAVQALQAKAADLQIKDIIGGLTSWASHIDTDFPLY